MTQNIACGVLLLTGAILASPSFEGDRVRPAVLDGRLGDYQVLCDVFCGGDDYDDDYWDIWKRSAHSRSQDFLSEVDSPRIFCSLCEDDEGGSTTVRSTDLTMVTTPSSPKPTLGSSSAPTSNGTSPSPTTSSTTISPPPASPTTPNNTNTP